MTDPKSVFEGVQDNKEYFSKWETLWHRDEKPRWDRGTNPALVELLQKNALDDLFMCSTEARKALVPGCGRGYDVALFGDELGSRNFTRVYGLEVSEKAVSVAAEYLEGKRPFSCDTSIVQCNFFDPNEPFFQNNNRFELVYDYTFLCAFPPRLRPQWAERMASIVCPGGLVVALQHPIDEYEGGPPFALNPQIYEDLLLSKFERVYFASPTEHHQVPRAQNDKMSIYRRL